VGGSFRERPVSIHPGVRFVKTPGRLISREIWNKKRTFAPQQTVICNMGNFGETVGKKERDKKKMRKRQDKLEKMEDRKAKNNKGKSLEEMMAYVDENGNLSPKPPDPRFQKRVKAEDMQISTPKAGKFDPADLIRTGIVTFFNDSKGFGFIKDMQSQESIFVHVNQLSERVSENEKVTFETESGPRGLNAINVKKVVLTS
jgi:cold shock CspA family protein